MSGRDSEHRAHIVERIAANRRQLEELERQLAALREIRDEGNDDDEHDPDGQPLSAQWSRLEGVRSALLAERAELDSALDRSTAGLDRTCAVCGGPIAAGRLEARPQATTCIDCARSTSS